MLYTYFFPSPLKEEDKGEVDENILFLILESISKLT
jgi:hypothetical protein